MAITIDGQVYRNLQEQVKYLTDKTLMTPQDAPATESLVAINTENAQSLLTVGNGLAVTGNKLASKVTYELNGTTLTITNQ